jgi:voltage-gated potassium channel
MTSAIAYFIETRQNPDTWAERRAVLADRFRNATEVPMLVLSVVFLLVMMLPDLVDLPDNLSLLEEQAEWAICALFALELVANTYLAQDRKRYLLSHWLELVTVAVPFLRPLRLLRVLVVGARFWSDARVILREHTVGLLVVASMSAVGVAAALESVAERSGDGPIKTFTDALWWAAATVTTVGYGDMYPVTTTGRAIGIGLMLVGVSLFGLLTARVAAFFLSTEESDDRQLEAIVERLERIERRLQDLQEGRRDGGHPAEFEGLHVDRMRRASTG